MLSTFATIMRSQNSLATSAASGSFSMHVTRQPRSLRTFVTYPVAGPTSSTSLLRPVSRISCVWGLSFWERSTSM